MSDEPKPTAGGGHSLENRRKSLYNIYLGACGWGVLWGVLTLAPRAGAEDPAPPRGAFVNVAAERGLAGVTGKTCCFVPWQADDTRLGVCVDRKTLFRPSPEGLSFVPREDHGIPFPEVSHVPVKDGKADLAKAKRKPFVPRYLYFADVNNDGRADALYGVAATWMTLEAGRRWRRVKAADHGQRSAVFLGRPNATFKPAPKSAYGSDDAVGPAMALAIVDVNQDGCLDLFEGREYRQYGQLYGCGIDRLWLGDGRGRFRDGTKAARLMTTPAPGTATSSRPTYGVTHADWNNDGWPDLLALSYGRQWNRLWKNNGDGTFTDEGRRTHFAGDDITHGRYPDWVKERMPNRRDEQPFRSNGNTFDCAIGDIDNDGVLDAFLGEIAHRWAGDASDLPSLLRNTGAKGDWVFRRETVRAFLPERTFRGPNWNYADLNNAFADFDCDGRLDLLIGSGDYPDGQFLRLYMQRDDGTFEDATEAAGFRWEGCGSISLADYDRDGDLDILAGRSFMRLNQKHRDQYMGGLKKNLIGLFENRMPRKGAALTLRLVGKGKGHANAQGIGARVVVRTGTQAFHREVRCGLGLSNHQEPTDIHVGLGPTDGMVDIEVRWPRRKNPKVVYPGIPVNAHVTLYEGKPTPTIEPFG